MPPRPVVAFTKKEAVFQLCNFLSTSSITTFGDLKDGQILQNTIQAKFPEFSTSFLENFDNAFDKPKILNSVKDDYSNKPNCLEENKSVVEDDVVIKNRDFYDGKNQETTSVISKCPVESVESYPAKNEDILLRFKYIQKFIDDCYQIKSEEIISYSKCTDCEFELMKVSMFVLSEIVKHLLKSNSEDLHTLFHLDVKYQVELEDIFKLFISERENISKIEVEKLLSKRADASPFVTPRRTSLRQKEQKSLSPVTPKEDIFTNSPLKVYFESPVIQKELASLIKEKKELGKEMELGDEEYEKLQCKYLDLEKELIKKDEHNKKLKDQIDELVTSYDALQLENNGLLEEKEAIEKNNQYLTDRVMLLSREQAELQKILEEKESLEELKRKEKRSSFSEDDKNILLKVIEEHENEKKNLIETIKSQDLKIFSYKKQIAELLQKDVKEQKSPGNLNQSYEEKWVELEQKRLAMEENLGHCIEMDHRDLSVKFMELISTYKKLVDENLNLKAQLSNQGKKVNQKRRIQSISTLSELINTSKTPETERFRKSVSHSKVSYCPLSDEPSYILNKSDDMNECAEQSSVSPDSSSVPCPENPCEEGLLWKMYDFQKSEAENSDVGLNNAKIDDGEAILLNQDNTYVLGNLNFNDFLNELKKLTKNGSFQKVLQIFGKCQKEINGTNKSKFLDLQDMLKIITECVGVAVALNAESSAHVLEDKCCMTDKSDLCILNQKKELEEKLNAVSLEYEIKLKELDERTKEKSSLELKCQDLEYKLLQKNQSIEEIVKKYNQLRINLDHKIKKYDNAKEIIQRLTDSRTKQGLDILEVKNRAYINYKKRIEAENNCKRLKLEIVSLQYENKNLKAEVQQLNKRIPELEKEALENKEKKLNISDFPSRESYVGIQNHIYIKTEPQWQDESALSSAFHKNLSHYVSENEDDFSYYNSLDGIKKEYKDDDRVDELKRRNTLLPKHLQSAYPIEELNTAYESLYIQGDEKCNEENANKKRKLDAVIKEEPLTNDVLTTPSFKQTSRRIFSTPRSLLRFMKNKNSRRAAKPKS